MTFPDSDRSFRFSRRNGNKDSSYEKFHDSCITTSTVSTSASSTTGSSAGASTHSWLTDLPDMNSQIGGNDKLQLKEEFDQDLYGSCDSLQSEGVPLPDIGHSKQTSWGSSLMTGKPTPDQKSSSKKTKPTIRSRLESMKETQEKAREDRSICSSEDLEGESNRESNPSSESRRIRQGSSSSESKRDRLSSSKSKRKLTKKAVACLDFLEEAVAEHMATVDQSNNDESVQSSFSDRSSLRDEESQGKKSSDKDRSSKKTSRSSSKNGETKTDTRSGRRSSSTERPRKERSKSSGRHLDREREERSSRRLVREKSIRFAEEQNRDVEGEKKERRKSRSDSREEGKQEFSLERPRMSRSTSSRLGSKGDQLGSMASTREGRGALLKAMNSERTIHSATTIKTGSARKETDRRSRSVQQEEKVAESRLLKSTEKPKKESKKSSKNTGRPKRRSSFSGAIGGRDFDKEDIRNNDHSTHVSYPGPLSEATRSLSSVKDRIPTPSSTSSGRRTTSDPSDRRRMFNSSGRAISLANLTKEKFLELN